MADVTARHQLVSAVRRGLTLVLLLALTGAVVVGTTGTVAAAGVDLSCTDDTEGAVYVTDTGMEVYESDPGIEYGTFPGKETVRFVDSTFSTTIELTASGSARAELDTGTGSETCLSDVQASTNAIMVEPDGESNFVLRSDLNDFAYQDPDYSPNNGVDVAYDAGNDVTVTFKSTGETDGTTIYAVDTSSDTVLAQSNVSGGDVTLTLPSGNNTVDLQTDSAPTFDNGTSATLTVYEDSTSNDVDSLLAASDGNGFDTLDWSVSTAPGNGTTGGFGVDDNVSAGSGVTPSGTTYEPDPDVSGTGADSFDVQVSDGTATDTITIDIDVLDAPEVSSITRDSPSSPTNADSVDYTVTFSESVGGVDTTDFTSTQVSGNVTGSVSAVGGSGSSYTVTVSGITGDGDLRLDLSDDDSITNGDSVPLGGVGTSGGAGDGSYTTGETFTFDNTAPTLDAAAKVDETTIDVDVSDGGSGIDEASIAAGDFTLSTGTVDSIDTGGVADGATGPQTVTVNLDSPVDADTVTVSLQADGIDDQVGNTRTTGSAKTTGMDGVPPNVSDVGIVDDTDANGVVADGDTVEITATVTDGESVAAVEADASAFDAGTVALADDGPNSSAGDDQYSATVSVGATPTEGDQSVTVDATDGAGNGGNQNVASTTLTVDTTAPPAPSTPDLDPASDTGRSSSDDVTGDATPTVSGTAEAGATVEVFSDRDGSLGTTTANGTGSWSLTVSSALSEGTHQLTATATDDAGNTGPASSALSVVVDTTAPPAPSTPDLDPASDTGPSSTDDVTNDTTPTVAGTAEADALVEVVSDQDGSLGTTTADGAGNWSFTPSSALSEGTHQLTATATDIAGNTGPASTALSVEVDVTPPDFASSATASKDEGTTGPVLDVEAGDDGTASPDANVGYVLGGTDSGPFGIDAANGSLGLDVVQDFEAPNDSDGNNDYELTVTATDDAGNADTQAITVTVTDVNEAPTATTDGYTTDEDTTLSVAAAEGVLANDADPEGDSLSASVVSDPTNGTLSLAADGSLTYAPDADFNGQDTFTYAASDGNLTDTATVTITVDPVNDPPTARNDSYATAENESLSVPAPGVLANDTDPEDDALTAALVSGPSHGRLVPRANGSFRYDPDPGFHGVDSFTYEASDGSVRGTDTARVTIEVRPRLDLANASVRVDETAGEVTLTYDVVDATKVGTFYKVFPANPPEYRADPGFFSGPTETDVPGTLSRTIPLSGAIDRPSNNASLQPGERYVFEAYVANRAGPGFGTVRAWFTTQSGPLAVDLSGRAVNASAVTLTANVTGFGGTDTAGSFFAVSPAGGSDATFVGGPTWDHPDREKATTITGLSPGTTYQVTIVVSNGDGDRVRKTVTVTTGSQTVAGTSVSVGGSTDVAPADVSGIGSADHHTRPSTGYGLETSVEAWVRPSVDRPASVQVWPFLTASKPVPAVIQRRRPTPDRHHPSATAPAAGTARLPGEILP